MIEKCLGSEWETIADTLAIIMDDEFSTVLDDNSSDEVGFQLCQLYQMYSLGNLKELSGSLSHLPNTTPINLNKVQLCSTQKVNTASRGFTVGKYEHNI